MKRMFRLRSDALAALSCAALAALLGAADAAAQNPPPPSPQPPAGSPIRKGPPACGEADKVEVVSFSVSTREPLVGTPVTARLKFKSRCPQGTADLRVPWEIVRGNTNLGTGAETLGPGATKEVTATWQQAEPGTHNLYGSVKLNDGGNNNTSDDVTATVLKEITLTHDAVQGTGAQFANNVEPGPHDCSRLGEFGANDTSLPLNGRAGVVFAAHCQLTGGKANPEAFKNLTLKNGWTVKVASEEEVSKGGSAGFNRLVFPSPGGTDPRTKLHVWADSRSFVYVRVVVVIRGPADRNPFQ